MQNPTYIETVYTLEQAERILRHRKLSYRIIITFKRLIKTHRTEIITYIKALLIGTILAVAFLLWLYSNGKVMDLCIYIGSFLAVIRIRVMI